MRRFHRWFYVPSRDVKHAYATLELQYKGGIGVFLHVSVQKPPVEEGMGFSVFTTGGFVMGTCKNTPMPPCLCHI